jgi:hypothetical protein
MNRTTLTQNGTFRLDGKHDESSSVIYVAGTFGIAGEAKLVTANGDGTFSDLEQGNIIDVQTQYYIEHGTKMSIFATLSNVDSTTKLVFTNAGIN